MTLTEQIITIAIAAVATMATRFIPFLVFPDSSKAPAYVKQLGDFLPPAIFGMLVIYCYKDVLLSPNKTLLIGLVAGIATALIHLWKTNMFLSIFVGTAVYMLLLQLT